MTLKNTVAQLIYGIYIICLQRNGQEKNEMRESDGGKFEVVQTFKEVTPPHGNDRSRMDNHDSTNDGTTLSFPSNCRRHREKLAIDNNRYSRITYRQQDDLSVEHNFGVTSEIEPTEAETVIPITRAAMIYVLCAALNSCNLGYDIGVSTNVSKLIQNDLHITDMQREIWIGFINFCASKLL